MILKKVKNLRKYSEILVKKDIESIEMTTTMRKGSFLAIVKTKDDRIVILTTKELESVLKEGSVCRIMKWCRNLIKRK